MLWTLSLRTLCSSCAPPNALPSSLSLRLPLFNLVLPAPPAPFSNLFPSLPCPGATFSLPTSARPDSVSSVAIACTPGNGCWSAARYQPSPSVSCSSGGAAQASTSPSTVIFPLHNGSTLPVHPLHATGVSCPAVEECFGSIRVGVRHRSAPTMNLSSWRAGLRGEFETQTQMLQQVSGSDGNKKREELSHHDEGSEVEWGKGPGSMTHSDTTPFSKRGNCQVATVPAKPKGALAQFLNPSWERKRAFITAQDALSALRTLLMSRSEVPCTPRPFSANPTPHPQPFTQRQQPVNACVILCVMQLCAAVCRHGNGIATITSP
eukprot:64601-Rhodomonas_salina.1